MFPAPGQLFWYLRYALLALPSTSMLAHATESNEHAGTGTPDTLHHSLRLNRMSGPTATAVGDEAKNSNTEFDTHSSPDHSNRGEAPRMYAAENNDRWDMRPDTGRASRLAAENNTESASAESRAHLLPFRSRWWESQSQAQTSTDEDRDRRSNAVGDFEIAHKAHHSADPVDPIEPTAAPEETVPSLSLPELNRQWLDHAYGASATRHAGERMSWWRTWGRPEMVATGADSNNGNDRHAPRTEQEPPTAPAAPSSRMTALKGQVSMGMRAFPERPNWPGQAHNNLTLSTEIKSDAEWGDVKFNMKLFGSWDNQDPRRTRFDIREAYIKWGEGHWNARLGIDHVFWGVTESRHLVDIINQTDVAADIVEETKLGQPMLELTRQWQHNSFNFFVLPYFRERPFPGPAGRLRSRYIIAQEQPIYESGAGEHHVDLAARYALHVNRWDIGISAFRGTQRQPSFLPAVSPEGDIYVRPYYGQIRQMSIDLQYTVGAWLWKAEALHRENELDAINVRNDYIAAVAGFEYTFFDIADRIDIGILLERLYDSRGKRANTPYQNDIFLGSRLVINDVTNTNVILGAIVDSDTRDLLWRLEANRRWNDDWTVQVKAMAFGKQMPGSLLYDYRKDTHVSITVTRWF